MAQKLTKAEFAKLVSEMPGASEEQILEEARKREQGTFGRAMEVARTPLTDAPSRAADFVANKIDEPSLDRSPLRAKLEGFAAGATQGVGDVLTQMTSPLDLALTALGLGGAKFAARGAQGLSRAARSGEVALQAPLVAEGAVNTFEGVKEGDLGKVGAGALEAGLGAAGIRATRQAGRPATLSREASPGLPVRPQSESPLAVQSPASRPVSPEPPRGVVPQSPDGGVGVPKTDPTLASPSIGTGAASPSAPVYGLDDATSTVASLTEANGGSTFNLHRGNLAGKGYAVAMYPDRGVKLQGKATPEAIRDYITKNEDLLSNPENSIGTWFNDKDGLTYLDISRTTDDLAEAIAIGKANKELAIFDLAKLEDISLQPPGHEFVPVGEEPEYKRPTFKEPEGVIPGHAGGKVLQFDEQKAALDKYRREAADQRIASGVEEPKTRGPALTTTFGVAGPAAALAIPDDPDSEWDDYARIGLTLGSVGALGMGAALAKAPKPKGVFQGAKGLQIVHPETGRVVKVGVGANTDNVRPEMTTQGIPPQWEDKLARVGLKNGSPPPAAPIEQLVRVDDKGVMKYTPEVEARLRTLYQLGEDMFRKEGGAEWLENGILDDLLKFLPVNDPKKASHRLFGATSPSQEVPGNLLDTLRIALRAKLRQGQGKLDTSRKAVQDDLMQGVGNRPSKAGNVQRALEGEPLQSYPKPDPYNEGKTEDLAKGMAGDLDAIPFDMWWARAVGADHDAQPANGISYKLFYDAGADVARRMGQEPFPFMAKVWAAMKHIHGEGGDVAPNKLAGQIGLGQMDLFDGSTTPGGEGGKKMLRQIQRGGADLLAGTGASKRADTNVAEDTNAKRMVGLAKESGFKGLRVFGAGRMKNKIGHQTYEEFVTNRDENTSFSQGNKNSQQATKDRMNSLKDRMSESVEEFAKHLVKQWREGSTEQPNLPFRKLDKELLMQRVEELLFPARTDKARYKDAMKPVKKP